MEQKIRIRIAGREYDLKSSSPEQEGQIRKSADMLNSSVPLPTAIPSVTVCEKDTTPDEAATSVVSLPCAANTCPLVRITSRKLSGFTVSTTIPAAFAFSGVRMISSECPACSAVSRACSSAS